MIFRLDDNNPAFPHPALGEENGLLAVGGRLSPEWLLLAYSNGIFPWFAFRDAEPRWYCPMDRFVIFPDEIHISHSTRNLINKKIYSSTFNKDFEGVINGCSKVNGRNRLHGAWLGPEMINAYTELHRLGYASSVEIWRGDVLVGGLYGVTIGNSFFGESMFSEEPGASKLALICLAQIMKRCRLSGIIDCQFETPHLKSMGGRHISYAEYMEIISRE